VLDNQPELTTEEFGEVADQLDAAQATLDQIRELAEQHQDVPATELLAVLNGES
jgi:hypothetical protein